MTKINPLTLAYRQLEFFPFCIYLFRLRTADIISFNFLIIMTSYFEYMIGLSKLLIGKSTIDVRECTMSGIGYPRKFANENEMIGNQQAISVATIKDTLKSKVLSVLDLLLESQI